VDQWILDVIRAGGYLGIALLMVVENAVPVIPSELILPFAGFLASDGDLDLVGALLASTAGSTAGAAGWYVIGRRWGSRGVTRFVSRHGVWLLLDVHDVRKAETWFANHKRRSTFFGRLVPGVRSLISIPAGVTGMRPLPFLASTVAGSALWNGILIGAGYLLAGAYHQAADTVGPIGSIVFGAVFLTLLIRFVRRRRRAAAG
jgi:membrane protein DedA with SNARE-associated domain